MLKNHLNRHGLNYAQHFGNNMRFTLLAVKSAFYTFGHAFSPRISGVRASELHNQLWQEGREASIDDLKHRLSNGLYANREEALADYQEYAALYNEEPVMANFREVINSYYP